MQSFFIYKVREVYKKNPVNTGFMGLGKINNTMISVQVDAFCGHGFSLGKTSVQSPSKTIETGFDHKGTGVFLPGFS